MSLGPVTYWRFYQLKEDGNQLYRHCRREPEVIAPDRAIYDGVPLTDDESDDTYLLLRSLDQDLTLLVSILSWNKE